MTHRKSLKDLSLSSTSSDCECESTSKSSDCDTYSSVSVKKDIKRIIACGPYRPSGPCGPCGPQNGQMLQFYTIVTPLTDLTTLNNKNSVGFTLNRVGNQVFLQWEPFSGRLTTNGVAFLTVLQSITNLPQYTVTFPIYLLYKGVGRMTTVVINPSPATPGGNIFFYLNTDQSTTGVAANDQVSIPGGGVSWVVE
jgi:hypothetical protein